ncbi:uncharacterized protein LOC108345216 isoform X2 [Vigna angularis]|uniref:uncharacterized protein LOC108345216 isoform X2 n=1 Tax=Phaseolus angularis TaxID=3914 RepID=UPI000809DE53|nr:uncharacterized protein LOC108345216 isoform X2 [Vigna angularis]
MGNSPSGPRLLGNGKYSSYDIKLGKAATISVKNEEGLLKSRWKLVYDVDEMACTLSIAKLTNERSETMVGTVMKSRSFSKFRESLRCEVETQSWTYTCATMEGLVVTQKKKKSNQEQPYMITVAHYYVNRDSGESGVDIGFSVVVKIGVANGKLDFSVEGPEEHPSLALLYMIEEVCRTGTWKPSACPHCNNIQSQQRRLVSESEDSDTNLPTPPSSHGSQQNASNKGRFKGDGIGNIIHAKEVKFIKQFHNNDHLRKYVSESL